MCCVFAVRALDTLKYNCEMCFVFSCEAKPKSSKKKKFCWLTLQNLFVLLATGWFKWKKFLLVSIVTRILYYQFLPRIVKKCDT